MLYFSKLRIFLVSLITLVLVFIAFSNLFNSEDSFFKKKINLGLDLQGGSYLLLEIDNEPVIEQKLQNLTSTIRNYFKDKNINLNNLKLLNKSIIFDVEIDNIDTVLASFLDENSEINPYYPRF